LNKAFNFVESLAQHLHKKLGARLVIVGGAVRDVLMGKPVGDCDCEVYGEFTETELLSVLQSLGSVNKVGKQFGVYKLLYQGRQFDIALPRLETQIGKGHKGFEVVSDPKLSFEEAAKRRDFTVNAMGFDVLKGALLDPFDGQSDLKLKQLKHVGPSFAEDPLRVYRAIQFLARFEFSMPPLTQALCQSMWPLLFDLSKERIWEEFKKLFLLAKRPSIGLQFAKEVFALHRFPEWAALIGIPQEPQFHPEGDVWIHTCAVVDAMAALLPTVPEEHRLLLMWAAVCHDLGKPDTTVKEDGRIRHFKHDTVGVAKARQLLYRLMDQHDFIEQVCDLVRNHMHPHQLYKMADSGQKVSDAAIRRLATRVTIELLAVLVQADANGKQWPLKALKTDEAAAWVLDRATALGVHKSRPEPFLKGQHGMALGLQPGPALGQWLHKAYTLQLQGQFTTLEEALTWAQRQFKK